MGGSISRGSLERTFPSDLYGLFSFRPASAATAKCFWAASTTSAAFLRLWYAFSSLKLRVSVRSSYPLYRVVVLPPLGGFATSASAFGRPATSAAPGAFGSSGFGSTAAQPASSAFGAFGQPTAGASTTTSAFGNAGAGAFGARPASSTFGQPAQQSNAFGATSNPQRSYQFRDFY